MYCWTTCHSLASTSASKGVADKFADKTLYACQLSAKTKAGSTGSALHLLGSEDCSGQSGGCASLNFFCDRRTLLPEGNQRPQVTAKGHLLAATCIRKSGNPLPMAFVGQGISQPQLAKNSGLLFTAIVSDVICGTSRLHTAKRLFRTSEDETSFCSEYCIR